jgi:adhesin transport system membrane fusion protein
MLNISKKSVSQFIVPKGYSTLTNVENKNTSKVLRRIIYIAFSLTVIILFLPWTQNVRAKGAVTTLKPNQKPQSLQSIIAGQIQQWYVQEGDYIKKGDTLLKISEIKDAYFDENLLGRTQNQLNFKDESIKVYSDKIKAQEEQINLLKSLKDLKLSQTKVKFEQSQLKARNDSIAHSVALINYSISEYQFNRADSLYTQGLKSLTDIEEKRIKLQQTKSYEFEAFNKWLNSKNELVSLKLELSNVEMKYKSDFNKLQSERFSTISNKLEAETSLEKLRNQFSNYEYRFGLYFITSPQDGYIAKTISNGIGETIKEGQQILTIMPSNYELAVAIYIKPIDLPLMRLGEKTRIQFDGWPAIVFSGWPNASHGTYGGIIYAIDQNISQNGKYRILIKPDDKDNEWPDALRFGSGSNTMILLNDVSIWYELWRQINGFPPDFYTGALSKPIKKKK